MNNLIISDIKARQILDSRGNPTVEADVILEGGAVGRAAVPSGASTGTFEALELRDGDDTRFGGKGVSKAVWNINSSIRDVLVGNTANQRTVDMLLLELDGTDNKSNLGANAILAVSLATAKAVANARRLPLYYYVAELAGTTELMSMPMPMMNLMNGGEHANWATDFQEYMVIPRSASTVAEAVRMGAEIFHSLKQVLKECDYPVTVGDEGGYAPRVKEGDNEPLDLITLAATRAGYQMGRDVVLAMDIASSEFYENGKYVLKTSGEQKTAAEMISWYTDLAEKYAVASIEDGLAESDWQNWRELTDRLGNKLQIVGDDLFVTNTQLLQRGIDEHVANSILVKPNQIGSLSETIDAVMLAKKAGYTTIVSHRSGETEDTTIAHLAVGLGAGQIKTGSLSRSERICKYNELMRIEETNPKLKLLDPFSR